MSNSYPESYVDSETGLTMTRGVRKQTYSYKGRAFTVEMPGWYPVDGEAEAIYTKEDCRVASRALNRVKAEIDHLMLPEQIRDIRKSLNLTQEEAGLLLGGGPRAFQKYECGDALPSKAISNLLLILGKRPDNLSLITA